MSSVVEEDRSSMQRVVVLPMLLRAYHRSRKYDTKHRYHWAQQCLYQLMVLNLQVGLDGNKFVSGFAASMEIRMQYHDISSEFQLTLCLP